MDTTAVLVAVIGSVASIAAAIITARTASRGARSTESVAMRQIEADAFKRARETYDDALDRQASQIKELRTQMAALQRQVIALTRQVRGAGLVPVIGSEEDAP
ncbi:hypothetical protein [Nonomuraea sp. NPDC050643]|uniref:hypothetical protein n=1 Tax=Nonomuraea sp. NPDC050643 TaxID=3155660 RepID=UPI0033DE44F6